MSLSQVETSLSEASIKFDEIVSRREKLIKESREVIALSSRAIVGVHSSNTKEAKGLVEESRKKLDELRAVAGTDLTRYLLTSEQEYVESAVLLAINLNRNIPSRRSLGVSNLSYVSGLLDTIGELKRSVYDSIRQGSFEKAKKLFSFMEQLYLVLLPFAVYDHIAQGVRRKLDVGRILIEDTRATITEESRRIELIQSINRLHAILGEHNE
jgi:translin